MSEGEALTPGDGVTAGALLRQAREAAGLHVATLAAGLKVPVRKIEALEEDRYDELPDAVFVRALASSICRTLKVDPAPVLQRLPLTPQPRLAPTRQGLNAPFRTPSEPKPGLLDQLSRPVVLTVLALLLGALVLIFLPLAQRGYDTVIEANRSDPLMPPPGAAATEPPPPPSVQSAPLAVPATPAVAPRSPAVTGAVDAGSAAGGVQLRTSAATVAPPPPAASAAAGSPPGSDGIIVFRARAQSWVQVKDAKGTTVMQRLLVAGETVGASGALPLSVTVGSAGATEVQVRGKPFDLAPLARDNVARFEVK